MAVSPTAKTVFVTGYSDGSTTGHDYVYATVGYNAATGAQLWVKRYSGPGNSAPSSMAVSPTGKTVFVTGYSAGTTTRDDYATVAYSAASGARLWVRRYNGPGNGASEASSIAVSRSGSTVYVTGYSSTATGDFDYATIAYKVGSGAQLWVRRYIYDPTYGDNYAYSVAVSPTSGTVFVTGSAAGNYDTIAYHG